MSAEAVCLPGIWCMFFSFRGTQNTDIDWDFFDTFYDRSVWIDRGFLLHECQEVMKLVIQLLLKILETGLNVLC